MRLLFAIAKYFPYGGLQRDMLRLALACRARGAEVEILCGEWEGERPEGLLIHEARLKAWSNVGKLRELAARAGARRGQFALSVGFHKVPGFDAYFCGDTCLAERVHNKLPAWARLLPRYRGFLALERAVFAPGGRSHILLLTERERASYQQHYATEAERLVLLPPGVDTARLGPVNEDRLGALRAELALPAAARVLLHVSANFQLKGLDRILTALAALPAEQREHTVLVVVGGDEPAPFLAQAERLGLAANLRFAGARDEMAPFYRLAELLVHPARSEAAGMTLLEATYCGLPVLTTGNCGYAGHIAQAGGWVLPEPYAQAGLNQALDQALSGELAPRRAAARRYADQTDLAGLTSAAATQLMHWAGGPS